MTEDLGKGLCLTETKNGWWLWSKSEKMNIAMKAKTREEALIEGLQSLQSVLTWVRERENKYYVFYETIMEAVASKDPERSTYE